MRPTSARVRKTLFDILGPRLPGSRFLDLFAGTGAVGLEALSRGATRVVLVDASREAVEMIRANAASLSALDGEVLVFRQDGPTAVTALAQKSARFDWVYVDPPYASEIYESTVALLDTSGLVAEAGRVVVEHFHKRALPETIGRFRQMRVVRIGDHRLTFYGRGQPELGGDPKP